MNLRQIVSTAVVVAVLNVGPASAQTCGAKPQVGSYKGTLGLMAIEGGGFSSFGKLNIDIDGYGKAYHPANYTGGALLHLCNAGRVYLADGSTYEGSESNATCTGKFMIDFKRIGDAGWGDSTVGAIHWYGIVGTRSAKVHGTVVTSVRPALQPDGSGFYVSPTSLADLAIKEPKDQSRYVNPLAIPFAVVPRSMVKLGIAMGSFGVAIDPQTKIPVPFVVDDGGPRVGEGSVALAYKLAGRSPPAVMTHKTSQVGQVDEPRVLWIFFGGPPVRYDHSHADQLQIEAAEAFQHWGGEARLKACVADAR